MNNGLKPVIIFDLETNGLSSNHSVLSVTALKAAYDINNKEFIEEDIYTRYYYPKEAYNPHAIAVNKLDQANVKKLRGLENYSEYFIDDLPVLKDFFGDTKHYIAHNIRFDSGFLPFKLPNSFCTMINNTDIIRIPKKNSYGWKWPNLAETAKFYDINMESSSLHTSEYDVKLTFQVVQKMLKKPDSKPQIEIFLRS